jgi:tetratricopeptide (TPR) repeat protein
MSEGLEIGTIDLTSVYFIVCAEAKYNLGMYDDYRTECEMAIYYARKEFYNTHLIDQYTMQASLLHAKSYFGTGRYLDCIKYLTGPAFSVSMETQWNCQSLLPRRELLLGHCYRDLALHAKANGEEPSIVIELLLQAKAHYESASDFFMPNENHCKEKKIGLCVVHSLLGNTVNANSFYNDLNIDASDDNAYPMYEYHRSLALQAVERYDLAHAAIDSALSVVQSPANYFQKGLIFLSQGHEKLAQEQFNEVLKQNPYHIPALYQRALYHHANGHTATASDAFSQLLNIMADENKAPLDVNYTMFIRILDAIENPLVLHNSSSNSLSIEPSAEKQQDDLNRNVRAVFSKYIVASSKEPNHFKSYRKNIAIQLYKRSLSYTDEHALQDLISLYWQIIPEEQRNLLNKPDDIKGLLSAITQCRQNLANSQFAFFSFVYTKWNAPLIADLDNILQELAKVTGNAAEDHAVVVDVDEKKNSAYTLPKDSGSLSSTSLPQSSIPAAPSIYSREAGSAYQPWSYSAAQSAASSEVAISLSIDLDNNAVPGYSATMFTTPSSNPVTLSRLPTAPNFPLLPAVPNFPLLEDAPSSPAVRNVL